MVKHFRLSVAMCAQDLGRLRHDVASGHASFAQGIDVFVHKVRRFVPPTARAAPSRLSHLTRQLIYVTS